MLLKGKRVRVSAFLLAVGLCAAVITPASAGMLNQAEQYAGLHEGKNNKTLKAILGVNPRKTPWCGHFLSVVAEKIRTYPAEILRLRQNPGNPSVTPSLSVPPNPVTLWSSESGKRYHAGILKSMSGATAQILGGNQSGRVQVSNFSRKSIVSVRR